MASGIMGPGSRVVRVCKCLAELLPDFSGPSPVLVIALKILPPAFRLSTATPLLPGPAGTQGAGRALLCLESFPKELQCLMVCCGPSQAAS